MPKLRAIRQQLMMGSLAAIADQATAELSTDDVIGWCALPAGSVLEDVSVNVHLIGTTDVNMNNPTTVGMHGFIIPVNDDDQEVDPNVFWDKFVPKVQEVSADMIDLDTDVADTEAADSFTEIDADSLFRVDGPKEVWKALEVLTCLSKDSIIRYEGANSTYRGCLLAQGKINKSYFIPDHSILMFAVSNHELPDDLDTYSGDQQQWVPFNDNDWSRLAHASLMLENAYEVAALSEADAGEPAEALDDLMRWLKQATMDVDDFIVSSAFNYTARFTYKVLFPDMVMRGTLVG